MTTATSAPALRFSGVTKRFSGGTTALAGAELEVSPGEFVAVVGPSGCGKSTLLRIASGLDDVSEGTVDVGAKRLGYVFQDATLLPWRTVEQNVRLALPADRTDADLGDLFETLGLRGHLSRYPGELSLGLARRTAIARAFAVGPDFLLLDEPFVSLDETIAARLREELLALAARAKATTLFVTHDLTEAVQMADRLFFLSDRPARIILEQALPPPRGARKQDLVASICDEMRALLAARAAIEPGKP